MEYLVTMTTHVPAGTADDSVAEIRVREAARAKQLAEQGHHLRLWRPPLEPGEWRTLGLFSAADDGELGDRVGLDAIEGLADGRGLAPVRPSERSRARDALAPKPSRHSE